jgi:ornithine cyclodeaminase/alanine dehydrogenase-like protein (mu-crystallin family)
VSRANTNTVLLLRPQEVTDVISMRQAIDVIEQGYREAAGYPLINAPRRRVHSPKSVRVSSFPGGIAGLGVIGVAARAETVVHDAASQQYPYREHPVHLLWDAESAKLLSIMIGEITEKRVGFSSVVALRTGATSGVGIRHLARKDIGTVGLFGAGGQALHKMLALKEERPGVRLIKVFSRNAERRKAFCKRVSALIDTAVEPADTPRAAVEGVDMIVCATSSNVPVFDGQWVEPGQHIITVVGSNAALVKGGWLKKGRRENDDETVRRADIIATNWRESVEQDQQAGLMEPLAAGIISWDKIFELGDIIAGKAPGRTGDRQITFHANNNGTAAAELAIAKFVYDRCVEMGRGVPIELPVAGTQ